MRSQLFVGIFVILLLILGAKADYTDFLRNTALKCAEELKIPQEAIRKFYFGGMKPEDATPAIKCHIKCGLEKRGTLKNQKHILEAYDKELSGYPEMKDFKPSLLQAASSCNSVGGPTECEEAYNYFTCFYKTEASQKFKAYILSKNL